MEWDERPTKRLGSPTDSAEDEEEEDEAVREPEPPTSSTKPPRGGGTTTNELDPGTPLRSNSRLPSSNTLSKEPETVFFTNLGDMKVGRVEEVQFLPGESPWPNRRELPMSRGGGVSPSRTGSRRGVEGAEGGSSPLSKARGGVFGLLSPVMFVDFQYL